MLAGTAEQVEIAWRRCNSPFGTTKSPCDRVTPEGCSESGGLGHFACERAELAAGETWCIPSADPLDVSGSVSSRSHDPNLDNNSFASGAKSGCSLVGAGGPADAALFGLFAAVFAWRRRRRHLA